jgi:hypothetical protein
MANLFGKNYSRSELIQKVGDISQIGGVKILEMKGGRSEGVQIARFWTGSGLEFDVNISRGMGIGAFRYKGIAFAWMSATGDVAPCYYEPRGGGLDRSYAGGLMHTCGLRQVGAPCEDEGEELGLHGRISNIPADQVCADTYWDGDDYILFITGKVKEVSALGENIILSRRISTRLGSNEVCIEDTVENAGPMSSPHMILYHTNFGFPLIDKGSRLVIPSNTVVDFIEGNPVPESVYGIFNETHQDAGAQIYFHDTVAKNGWSGYVIANDTLGLGLQVSYQKKNLPQLINWVYLEPGRNVVEVGPSNCKCFGRKSEKEAGTLEYLEPGEIRNYQIQFKVLSNQNELELAVKAYQK